LGPPSTPPPLRNPELRLPAVTVDDYGDRAHYCKALKQIFDALWNAGGYQGSQSYDVAGNWNRRQ
jgi:hypothetical protein